MAIAHVLAEEALGRKFIAFDQHAVVRMKQRRITEDEVFATLRQPDLVGLPTQANRMRYRKFLSGRRIDIVFELDPTQVVVITVIG